LTSITGSRVDSSYTIARCHSPQLSFPNLIKVLVIQARDLLRFAQKAGKNSNRA